MATFDGRPREKVQLRAGHALAGQRHDHHGGQQKVECDLGVEPLHGFGRPERDRDRIARHTALRLPRGTHEVDHGPSHGVLVHCLRVGRERQRAIRLASQLRTPQVVGPVDRRMRAGPAGWTLR